jgi:regulator of cell morphogenesis and NO signaling
LLTHMQKEELVLFPFISEIDVSASDGRILRKPYFGNVGNSIRIMLVEHDRPATL